MIAGNCVESALRSAGRKTRASQPDIRNGQFLRRIVINIILHREQLAIKVKRRSSAKSSATVIKFLDCSRALEILLSASRGFPRRSQRVPTARLATHYLDYYPESR